MEGDMQGECIVQKILKESEYKNSNMHGYGVYSWPGGDQYMGGSLKQYFEDLL